METDFLKMMGGLGSPIEQGALLLAAILLAGFGIVVLMGWMARREKTTTREGRAVGLRAAEGHFFTVYEYRDDEGHLLQATEEHSFRTLSSYQADAMKQIHVPEHRPDIAAADSRGVAPAAGALMVAAGFFAAARALTVYPVNGFTFATILVLLVFFFKRFGKRLPTAEMRNAYKEWREKHRDALVTLPVQSPDNLTQTEDPDAMARVYQQEKTLKIMGPVYMLAGAAAIAGALYVSGDTIDLTLTGESTRGIVTELEERGGDKIPVVHFRDGQGNAVRFEGKTRFDLPVHIEGDEVGVLYMKEDPAATAAIDYGLRIWLIPGLLAAFGLFTLMAGMTFMPRQRDEIR